MVFRGGPDQTYAVWPEFKSLPVISVAPIQRPKLDAPGQAYLFPQEKELMKEKIRIVLRIAAAWGHRDLCVGAFGAGPSFRNPVCELARMWKDVLFSEPEFKGAFCNIVFAIESEASPEFEAFKLELDPSNVCKTTFR